MVLLPSGDQDNTYATYIQPNWPKIEYRQFREGPHYGYGAQINASPENAEYLTSAWMKTNVSDRGPLGDLYRVWGDGKQMVPGDKVDYFGLSGYTNEELKEMGYFVWLPVQAKGSWLGEGDNHTFMNMLGNGLRAYEHGSYGGWGGRVTENRQNSDAFSMSNGSSADEMAAGMGAGNDRQSQTARPYPNFFPQAQRNFANRLQWSVTNNYDAANHEPVVAVEGSLQLLAAPGQKIPLFGAVSDPDGDDISVSWWQFHAGSYLGEVAISNPDATRAELLIPEDAADGQTIHIVFEATDHGQPSLTRYQRVIIRVRGE